VSCKGFTLTDGVWTSAANALTVAGDLTYVGGTWTACTGGITMTGTGTIADLPALVTNPLVIDATGEAVTIDGAVSVSALTLTAGDLICAANDFTVAGNLIHTAGTITGTGEITVNTTANLKWICPTQDIVVDGGATTATATGVISCSLLTFSSAGGILALETFDHIVAGGFIQSAGTVTGTGSLTLTGTGTLALPAVLTTLDVEVDAPAGVVSLGANISLESLTLTDCTTFAAGAYTVTCADSIVHTAGAITGTGLWKISGTGNLKLDAKTVPLEIDATAVTCTGAVTCKTFAGTGGTYADSGFNQTFYGNCIMGVGMGIVTATGRWTMAATGTFTLVPAQTTMSLHVAAGTTTLGDDVSCANVFVAGGATLDADSHGLTLAAGNITGYGTVTNLVPAGAISCGPGIIDGGGNHANVTFETYPVVVKLDL